MTASYTLARLAQADLDAIWDYISERSPAAADRLIDRLRSKFSLLARQPLLGQLRDDLRPNLRSFVAKSYVIYYQFINDQVTIVRVIHAARDTAGLF
jgi:toxin ParE1/3/4